MHSFVYEQCYDQIVFTLKVTLAALYLSWQKTLFFVSDNFITGGQLLSLVIQPRLLIIDNVWRPFSAI